MEGAPCFSSSCVVQYNQLTSMRRALCNVLQLPSQAGWLWGGLAVPGRTLATSSSAAATQTAAPSSEGGSQQAPAKRKIKRGSEEYKASIAAQAAWRKQMGSLIYKWKVDEALKRRLARSEERKQKTTMEVEAKPQRAKEQPLQVLEAELRQAELKLAMVRLDLLKKGSGLAWWWSQH